MNNQTKMFNYIDNILPSPINYKKLKNSNKKGNLEMCASIYFIYNLNLFKFKICLI